MADSSFASNAPLVTNNDTRVTPSKWCHVNRFEPVALSDGDILWSSDIWRSGVLHRCAVKTVTTSFLGMYAKTVMFVKRQRKNKRTKKLIPIKQINSFAVQNPEHFKVRRRMP